MKKYVHQDLYSFSYRRKRSSKFVRSALREVEIHWMIEDLKVSKFRRNVSKLVKDMSNRNGSSQTINRDLKKNRKKQDNARNFKSVRT